MSEVCKSHVAGSQVCADGFPQIAACHGARCDCCGSWSAERKVPYCMRGDWLDPRFMDEAGRMKLADRTREASHAE